MDAIRTPFVLSPEQKTLVGDLARHRGLSSAYFAMLSAAGTFGAVKFVFIERLVKAGTTDAELSVVAWLLVATVGCWILGQFLVYGSERVGTVLQRRITVEKVIAAASVMLGIDVRRLGQKRGPETVFFLRTGLKTVSKSVRGIEGALTQFFLIAFSMAAAIWMQPILGVLSTVSALVMAARTARHMATERAGMDEQLAGGRQLHATLHGIFRNLPQVKMFGLDADDLRNLLGPVVHRQKEGERLTLSGERRSTLEINVAAAIVGLVMLGCGALLVRRGIADVPQVTSILVLHQSVFMGVRRLLGQWGIVVQHEHFLAEFMAKPDAKPRQTTPMKPIPGPIQSLVWDDAVLFSSVKKSFPDVRIHLVPGQFYGIAGPSEWANQKILRLLADVGRISAGTLLVNDLSIDEVDQDDWERRVVLARLPTILVDGTLSDNLRLAREDATDEEMIEALTLAAMGDDFDRMREQGGLEAPIGRNGIQLSPGQQQRLAIARGILRRPEFLLVDDPFLTLDRESAHHVLATLREISRQAIVVMVANSAEGIEACDEFLLVSEEKFIAQATRARLMAEPSLRIHLSKEVSSAA